MVFGLDVPKVPTISNMNFINPSNMLNNVSSTFSSLLSLQQMTSGGNMQLYLLGGAGVVLYLIMK